MTTNAILLPKMADRLVAAGLSRVNIHVDTLNPENLKRVMRFGAIEQIWAGVEAAQAAGLNPIKINSAVTRDYNDADVIDLARLTLDHDWHVRFIELMPFGDGECASVSLSQYVPSDETKARIESALGTLSPLTNKNDSDESVNYRLPNGKGVVGFISPVSAPYCGNCNRMRLTSDGRFHLCLLNDDELDVKAALRNGADVADIEAILLKAVHAKPTGHRLEEGIHTENRDMFQIGG
jgi:cyclic pyranopterin phosphate synthase